MGKKKKRLHKGFYKLAFSTLVLVFLGCATEEKPKYENINIKPEQVSYAWIHKNIIKKRCLFCHGGRHPYLATYKGMMSVVEPGEPNKSKIFEMLDSGKMPKGSHLPPEQIAIIHKWIKQGAKK